MKHRTTTGLIIDALFYAAAVTVCFLMLDAISPRAGNVPPAPLPAIEREAAA